MLMERLVDSSQSDDRLMAASAGGAADAFRLLVDRQSPSAWRLAWRLTGDRGAAEDMVQEGFARLWRQAPRWQAGQGTATSGVGAFLQRVITNLAIDRSRRPQPQLMDELPDNADPAPLADALLAQADLATRIQTCLTALPDRQRAAIVLTYWEGLTGPMAAEVMELSPKAFESLLIRARVALKAVFAAAGIDTSLLPGESA